MSDYKHNIATDRNANIVTSARKGGYNVQVVVGTAPVNLLDDPAGAVNVPVVVKSRSDVQKYFGWSTEFDKYTLMQAAYASFQIYAVAPVIFINVLDPSKPKHVTAVAETEIELLKGSAVIEDKGILLDSIVVSRDGAQAEKDTDYAASFDAEGNAVVSVAMDGALADADRITVAYTKLAPEGVAAEDIIGGVDENGVRTGIELIDEIYIRKSILPMVLSAPGYSKHPAVAFALEAKAELAGDFSNGIAVVDLETETTRKCEDVKKAKEALGAASRWSVACWPNVYAGGAVMEMSAVVSALLQYACIQNSNIPCESPDNLDIGIDGLALSDGTEIHMTQAQVNDYINACGVVSCIYMGGWKCWGNNTTAYPIRKNPNDRFIKCVMMSNYLENRFKTEYLSSIGRNLSVKLIDSIITTVNAEFNALVPDYLADAEIIFDKADNPIDEILEGRLRFRTRYADWTPIEYIENTFTWDSTVLQAALEGGDE